MKQILRDIFLLIVFSPVLLIGQDLNYKVLNTFNSDIIKSKILMNPQSLGDINNDGINEIVLSQQGTDSLFIIYLNKNAEATRIKVVDISFINDGHTNARLSGYYYKEVRVIGDLDNDGVFEIAVGSPVINKGIVCILFLDTNGEIKKYNIIDPYLGENPFYSDFKPADRFGYAVFPFGDVKDKNSPDLIIVGYENLECDSLVEYSSYREEYFDTVYYTSYLCIDDFNDPKPIIFSVKLNSDGTVNKHNTLEILEKVNNENDSVNFQFNLMPQEVCNIGDIDGNGASDMIFKGVINSYFVYFNEDYSVKSSGMSLFNEDISEDCFSGPGCQFIATIPDINMDGIPEFIFSTLLYNDGSDGSDDSDDSDGSGKLYVGYLDSSGKVNKLDTLDFNSITNMNRNELIYNNFGMSVSHLGDINDDGYSEVLVYSFVSDKIHIGSGLIVNPPFSEEWIRLSLNGTELRSDRYGNKGSAYHFNGENNHVTAEISEKYYIEEGFPHIVSLWFKIDAFGDTSSVLYASEEISDNYSGFWVDYLPNGKITAGYGDGQGNSEENRRSKVSNSVIDTSSWHNVVAVFNGLNDIELYIDCQLDSGTYSGSGNSLSVNGNRKSVIGRSLGHSASSYHNGKIDELRVYYSDLPRDQIERLCTGDSIFEFYYGGISIISIYPDSCLDSECVWPGDANFDGIVSSTDIIQIGSVFSQTSDKKRTMATTDWVEQTCEDWSLNKFNVNAKHADSDGNGVVNFLDASVVEKNYSKVSFKMDETVLTDPFGPPLYIIPNKDTVTTSDSISYSITFGSLENRAENIYGVSMKLQHDVVELFGSGNTASFSGSWLGTKNVDMIATGFPLEDGIDIGMSRTDQVNRTGYGYLATVDVVTPDNLVEINKDLVWEMTGLTIVSYEGDTIYPNVIFGDPVVIMNREELDVNILEKGLKVYPNPNSGIFNIDSRLELDGIRIMDLSGRTIKDFHTPSQHEVLNLSGFEKGVYLIEFQSGNLTAYERVFMR